MSPYFLLLCAVAGLAGPAADATPKWPTRGPVRVWIAAAPTLSQWGHRDAEAARRAVLAWNALDVGIRFAFSADSSVADLRITWTDRFDESISGRTWCTDDGSGRITSARVVLAVHHMNGKRLRDEETQAMALHEIGHALGLAHSDDHASVMSPTVRVRRLSAGDRAAALRLYGPAR